MMKKLVISFLAVGLMHYSYFAYAQEVATPINSAETEMEKKITEDAEQQKTTQLKEYFREYYYKQGKERYKKGHYEEATAQFQRVLYWDPSYEPVLKYIKLIEDKTGQKITLTEEVMPKPQEPSPINITADQMPPPPNIVYKIDKEDTLEVSVWRHPELTRELIVRPDGAISFPLIGEIQVSGMTVPELAEKITQGLTEFTRKKLKPSLSEKAEEKAEYLVGSGDTLGISVWKEPDLTSDIIVRPDGMISFPLVGDIKAIGRTLTQLDEELTKELSNYVKEPQVSIMVRSFGWKKDMPEELFLEENPEVSVMIKKFGGKKIIVLGDVKTPGVYTFTGDIRLIEALALAGNYTKFAVKNNILIIRGDINNKPQVISANIAAFLKNAKLKENVLIQAQDVIFVPHSLIGNIDDFVQTLTPWVNLIYQSASANEAIKNIPQ
ncbi:MAG: hypothetical protein A2166_03195 [Omnitrophica WOR_2 bacterium RBG_13_41_10]|nr:MAG: hypothetical protein A2166_03195 [Omnitrophica WOR_2 bacterium RBG_13_41_10]